MYKINITKVKNIETLLTDAAVTFSNTNKVCGKTDWVKNVEADLSVCNSANLGDEFDIADIQDNKLYFGDPTSNTGDVDGNRYDSLDDKAYIKQP